MSVTGGCLCGAVRFKLAPPLRDVVLCHCSVCRRIHGHVGAYTNVARAQLEFEVRRGVALVPLVGDRAPRLLRRLRFDAVLRVRRHGAKSRSPPARSTRRPGCAPRCRSTPPTPATTTRSTPRSRSGRRAEPERALGSRAPRHRARAQGGIAPLAFIHKTRFADLPGPVVAQARLLLLDLAGVAAAATKAPVFRITADHAAEHMRGSRGARMLLDGRRVAPAAAAFVGATLIDSFDAHDGHPLTKGHIGVSVLPTLLALAEPGRVRDGRDLLTSFVIGYELGTRAGIALHATAADYHTSGAWGALAAAALAARHLRLSPERTRHALGAAEFHGPRSQMMRCVELPTMVKDGSGWGAYAGLTAALLAARGYTGAPAVTLEETRVAGFWDDLGRRWRLLEQYIKPYPVCRWAQPAMEAVAALVAEHRFAAADVARVEVRGFREAVALTTRAPATTEEAQYSLSFPVAAMLARGRFGAGEAFGRALADETILRLSRSMVLTEWPEFSRRFPAERWSQVVVTLADGRTLTSAPSVARGGAENRCRRRRSAPSSAPTPFPCWDARARRPSSARSTTSRRHARRSRGCSTCCSSRPGAESPQEGAAG
jgi:2-methylcitrate dehydratase PrpD